MVQIHFKLTSGEHGYLCNFYKKQFIADGIKWRTSEHYYQWLKLKFLQSIGEPVDDKVLTAIVNAKTASDSKRIGHIKLNNVDQWDEIKVEAMMKVIRAKFTYPRFRTMLIATGDAELIESSYYDRFWGDGGSSNRGLNMLGKCLMRLRNELKEEATEEETE